MGVGIAPVVCLATLVSTRRDYEVAKRLYSTVSTFANVKHYMYAPASARASAFSDVITTPHFPVKLNRPEANWRYAHERLGLFNHTIGVCDWVVSTDIDVVVSRPFPELFKPSETMLVTYGMDPGTYPWGVNGGLFAFRPDVVVYEKVLDIARSCVTCNDQTVISKLDVPMTVLSHIYNMSPALCNQPFFGTNQYEFVKLWHFTYVKKPWHLHTWPDCVQPM